MSLSPHSTAVLIRAEVMKASENIGEAYDKRMSEIQQALDSQIKESGLATRTNDTGMNVVHFRNESEDVALADSPTGQIVPILFAQYFVLFKTATRDEVAKALNRMTDAIDARTFPGVSWQFFDPQTFLDHAQTPATGS